MGGIALTGLASGMDTSAMIEELMKLERRPYTELEKRKTTITSNQEIMRSINTKLSTLKTAASDLMYTTAFTISSAKASNSTLLNVSASPSAAKGTYSVEVTDMAKKHSVKSGEFEIGSNVLTGLVGQKFTISGKGNTEGVEIELRGDNDSAVLSNLMADINAAKKGVTASVVETKPGFKTLVLTSDEYGTEKNMALGVNADADDKRTFISDSGGTLSALGLSTGSGLNVLQAAENAKLKVNGLEIESSSNSLKDVVPGLTIDILQAGTSTITVNQDADAVADKVQKFVDAYNDVIEVIRKNMAKGEVLQGDSTLRTLESELSSMLNSAVGGPNAYKFLANIGIEVDKGVTTGALMDGKIDFDKEIFKKALAENPDDVYNLFAYDDESEANNDGIGMLFNQALNSWTRFGTGILASKIKGYDSDISVITDQMERMDMRLKNKETMLQKQFAAMEAALMNMQSQQSWLSNQLNALM